MNSVVLVGNLTRDPELRYSTGANQTAICRFGIAVNDGYGDKQETNFINIVVFGKQAENCDRFLAKGRKVAINGRIQTGSYEKDGRKVYTTDVVASRVEFLGGAGQSGSTGGNSGFGGGPDFGGSSDFGGQQSGGQQSGGEEPGLPGGFTSLQDDDIPF
ncbi:MAG: single-stranded DNA-binding protein [Bacillota bacterium]|nr:single-stranded DNA-binding protein [Bacillota bacterium]